MVNRSIRDEVLYKICVESDDSIIGRLNSLKKKFDVKLKVTKKDKLEADDLVDLNG